MESSKVFVFVTSVELVEIMAWTQRHVQNTTLRITLMQIIMERNNEALEDEFPLNWEDLLGSSRYSSRFFCDSFVMLFSDSFLGVQSLEVPQTLKKQIFFL